MHQSASVPHSKRHARSSLAARHARAVHQVRPRNSGGRREGRALAAPVARLRKKCRRQVPQVWPNTPGLPCATVGTAYTWSPWCTGLVGHHVATMRLRALRWTPASGCQDRTISPCATNRSSARHEATLRFLAPIASHSPRLMTVATRPSGGSRTGDIYMISEKMKEDSLGTVEAAATAFVRPLPEGAVLAPNLSLGGMRNPKHRQDRLLPQILCKGRSLKLNFGH